MDFSNFWWQAAEAPDPGPPIGNSLRFRGAQALTRQFALGDRSNWSWSQWIKFTTVSTSHIEYIFTGGQTGAGGSQVGVKLESSQLKFATVGTEYAITQNKLRDPSGWYHILVTHDLQNATSSERVKIYINGEQAPTTYGPALSPTYPYPINTNVVHVIGGWTPTSYGLNGYMGEVNFVDGQTLDPTEFGEYNANGVWTLKEYTGTYGTNGFYLDFSDPADIGADRSGNGNDFTPNGFQLADQTSTDWDQMLDSPTGNYATGNPLFNNGNWQKANLDSVPESETGYNNSATTQSANSKFYCEATIGPGDFYGGIGLLKTDAEPVSSSEYVGTRSSDYGIGNHGFSDYRLFNASGSGNNTPTGITPAAGDILQMAYDPDTSEVWFGVNGVWVLSGDPTTGSNPAYTVADTDYTLGTTARRSSHLSINAGQRPFTYTPPNGFKTLQSANLPAASIANGRDHFQAITGPGAGILTAAQTAFSNGLWWIKDRANSNQHQLVNSINGAGNVSQCPSAVNAAYAAPAGDSVAWCWNASEAFSFDGSGGINGLIPVAGFRDQAAGFSLLNYTCNNLSSQNIAHGLTAPPELIIWKDVNRPASFVVWHTDFAITEMIQLNTTNGIFSGLNTLNARPNEFLVFLGNDQNSSANGETFCMYAWHSVPGYSAIGSYKGNGSDDGPFIYTGFRPAFVMVKGSTLSSGWMMYTTETMPNPNNNYLVASASNAENTPGNGYNNIDILSNGFKVRDTLDYTHTNQAGETYIYFCFAENPFGGSNVAPANAR